MRKSVCHLFQSVIKNILIASSLLPLACFSQEACYPDFDSALPQFIVGYGSLISSSSKHKTDPNAGESIPIELNGFKRGFFAKGSHPGFTATFLGVIVAEGFKFNAVTFQLRDALDLLKYDEREVSYCRHQIAKNQIVALTKRHLSEGQYWIYLQKNSSVTPATKEIPMTLSYVDEFLSGCLEIGDQYHLTNFARECVSSTSDWSIYWVNDRIFPRRSRVYQPNATKIDNLLLEMVPTQFHAIKIE